MGGQRTDRREEKEDKEGGQGEEGGLGEEGELGEEGGYNTDLTEHHRSSQVDS